jgi:hypothetical protein
MLGTKDMKSYHEKRSQKKNVLRQRSVEVDVTKDSKAHLEYFVRQELGYYNSIVEQLSPRIRAFPQDLLSIKDREKKLWEVCAEFAVDVNQMISHPVEEWPKHLKPYSSLVWSQEGAIKLTPAQLNLMKVAAVPAKLHPSIRKAIATEVLKYVTGQAEAFAEVLNGNDLKSPMQMLQSHTFETRRHLQIPAKLVKITYDTDSGNSKVSIPYSKDPLTVIGYDVSQAQYNILIIRAPHPHHASQEWKIEFRDNPQPYLLFMNDHNQNRQRIH